AIDLEESGIDWSELQMMRSRAWYRSRCPPELDQGHSQINMNIIIPDIVLVFRSQNFRYQNFTFRNNHFTSLRKTGVTFPFVCGTQKKPLDPLELELIDGCEPPCGFWELNLGPPQEQLVSFHLQTSFLQVKALGLGTNDPSGVISQAAVTLAPAKVLGRLVGSSELDNYPLVINLASKRLPTDLAAECIAKPQIMD
ncbi:hypothetical protein STEG23_019051, partial [Scotinomys teguina]